MGRFPDIYKLTENGIRILLTSKLEREINLFLKNKSKLLKKDIAKSLNIDYTTLWDYLNRRTSIPLLFFQNLKKKYNIDLSDNFEYFEVGHLRKRVKVVKDISNDLAKILGAHVADGCLRIRSTYY